MIQDRIEGKRYRKWQIFYAITTRRGVKGMKVGFIGAGKVGFSLGKYFKTHGVSVVGYYSKTPESAKSAADLADSGVLL